MADCTCLYCGWEFETPDAPDDFCDEYCREAYEAERLREDAQEYHSEDEPD